MSRHILPRPPVFCDAMHAAAHDNSGAQHTLTQLSGHAVQLPEASSTKAKEQVCRA